MNDALVLTGANAIASRWASEITRDAWDYWIDAYQRGMLFLDVLQKRRALPGVSRASNPQSRVHG